MIVGFFDDAVMAHPNGADEKREQRQGQFSGIDKRAMRVACWQGSWQAVIAKRKEAFILRYLREVYICERERER